jgi:hypothetical protein
MLRFDLYHRSQRHTATIESCGLPFKVSSAEVLPGGCIETLGLSNVLRQCSVHWQSTSGGIVPSVNAVCDLSASTKRSKEMVCRSQLLLGVLTRMPVTPGSCGDLGFAGKATRIGRWRCHREYDDSGESLSRFLPLISMIDKGFRSSE